MLSHNLLYKKFKYSLKYNLNAGKPDVQEEVYIGSF